MKNFKICSYFLKCNMIFVEILYCIYCKNLFVVFMNIFVGFRNYLVFYELVFVGF